LVANALCCRICAIETLLTVWEQPNEMKVTIIDGSASADDEPVVLSRCN